ncbi:MAG: hypothetical protein U1E76_14260 [Planctomycetota bacterium]
MMQAGDCGLRPIGIQHRVLACADGLEVIRHWTAVDHDLELPTATADPGRSFGGQPFTRHEAGRARWQPTSSGFQARDLGIAAASLARPMRACSVLAVNRTLDFIATTPTRCSVSCSPARRRCSLM